MRRYCVLFFGCGCGMILLSLVHTHGLTDAVIMFALAVGIAFGVGLIVKSFGGI